MELRSPIPLKLDGANLEGFRVVPIESSDRSQRESHLKALEMFLAALSPEQRAQVVVEEEKKESGTSSGCFIATAACGTASAPDVVVLREFRDRVLERSSLGRRLVNLYVRCSPPVARLISRSETLKLLTRHLLVRPLASGVRRWPGSPNT